MSVTILPSQPPSPVRRPPSPRVALIGVAAVAVVAVVLAFVTGVFGGSKSSGGQRPAAASSLAGLTGAQILARARAAALSSGAAHLTVTVTAAGRSEESTQDAYADSGVQRLTIGDGRAEVRVIGASTYFTGNRSAMTKFFGVPANAVPPSGVWFRLHRGDAAYDTVTDAVTLSSLLHEVLVSAPITVLPVSQRRGVSVVGLRGHGPASKVLATLWVAATGPALPVEWDANDGHTSVATVFSNWGVTGKVARPAHVRPAPRQSAASSPVADADMKANLRNLATIEEVYLTDSGTSYGTARQLRHEGLSSIKLAAGQTITIHLAGINGYCFAGKVAAGRYFIYSSQDGGLSGPASSDTCSASMYPADGGQLPLT